MRQAGAGFVLALVLAACGSTAPAPRTPPVSAAPEPAGWPALDRGGRPLAPLGPYRFVTAPDGRSVAEPASARIEHGVAFRYALGHCGLLSPVDLDGSFWEAIEVTSADGRSVDPRVHPEMINATDGVVAVIGDEARFRTDGGTLVRFERLPGEMAFAACD